MCVARNKAVFGCGIRIKHRSIFLRTFIASPFLQSRTSQPILCIISFWFSQCLSYCQGARLRSVARSRILHFRQDLKLYGQRSSISIPRLRGIIITVLSSLWQFLFFSVPVHLCQFGLTSPIYTFFSAPPSLSLSPDLSEGGIYSNTAVLATSLGVRTSHPISGLPLGPSTSGHNHCLL